jgi:hypothetical protein
VRSRRKKIQKKTCFATVSQSYQRIQWTQRSATTIVSYWLRWCTDLKQGTWQRLTSTCQKIGSRSCPGYMSVHSFGFAQHTCHSWSTTWTKKRKERRKKELIITHFTGQAKNLL